MNNYIKQQTINDRIYSRNIPSGDLEPYLSTRPVNTKYVYLQNIPHNVNINLDNDYPTYNVNTIFNPGNTTGPWSGFSSNIDTETILRDQSHNNTCELRYVPDYNNSDLYTISGPYDPKNIKEFPYLVSTSSSMVPPNNNNNINTQSNPNKLTDIKQPITFNTHTRLLR